MTGSRLRAWARCTLAVLIAGAALTGTARGALGQTPGAIRCGQVLTESTTLSADVGPCPGDGLIIGADNVRLDLNGHRVFGAPGPGDGNAAGIRLPNRRGVIVQGGRTASGGRGTVTDFDAGVVINRGSRNVVIDLVVRDNIGPASRDAFLGDGIAVLNSVENRIERNSVDHNGIYDGIGVLGNDAHRNTIAANTVTRSVALVDPTGGPEGNGTGVGIIVDAFLEAATGKLIRGNNVTNNVVRANDGPGISNVNTQDGRVTENTIEDNGHVSIPGNGIGMQLGLFPESREGRMLVERNTIRRNGGTGVYSTSNLNKVVGNIIEDNGFQPPPGWDPFGGIYMEVDALGGSLVRANTVRHNGGLGLGIFLNAVDRASGNVTGPSSNNRIEYNRVTDHAAMGIFLWVSGGRNYVLSNYAVNNPGFGDLVDGGGAFGSYEGCGDNVWYGNTYEVAVPPCAGNGGRQVSVPDGAPAAAAAGANSRAARPPTRPNDGADPLPPTRPAPRA